MNGQKALIEQMVIDGMAEADAVAAIGALFAAIPSVLKRGKAVTIPGVCQLLAPEKPAWAPGYQGRRAHVQRKVIGRHYAVLERGEAYDTRGAACFLPLKQEQAA